MKDFAIVAGTLLSDKSISELQKFLNSIGLTSASSRSDHIKLAECFSFELRRGFDHEYQVVGDASTLDKLLKDVTMVSTRLTDNQVEHSFEIYDVQGEIAAEFSYP